MKKVKVKVLETNKKSFKVEFNGKSLWIRKRSLLKNDMVNFKMIESGLEFMNDLNDQRQKEKDGISFTILKETEKAISFKVIATCTSTDQVMTRTGFVPKSLIQENGNIPTWFANKKLREINAQITGQTTLEMRIL